MWTYRRGSERIPLPTLCQQHRASPPASGPARCFAAERSLLGGAARHCQQIPPPASRRQQQAAAASPCAAARGRSRPPLVPPPGAGVARSEVRAPGAAARTRNGSGNAARGAVGFPREAPRPCPGTAAMPARVFSTSPCLYRASRELLERTKALIACFKRMANLISCQMYGLAETGLFKGLNAGKLPLMYACTRVARYFKNANI